MLLKPDKKLSKKIVTELGYEQRIEGFRLRERAGVIPAAMYSFEEVTAFLSDPYPRIDFLNLAQWIRNVFEDHELAENIDKVIKTNLSDHEKTSRIRDFMEIRLIQCKKMG
jgi:hypothetical protein